VSPASTSVKPIRVGLVEPRPLLSEITTQALSNVDSVEIVWATSGAKEARELFLSDPVDVVLTELELGNGNGVGLGLSLHKAHPRLGVVLIVDELVIENFSALDGLKLDGWRIILRSDITGIQGLVDEIIAAANGEKFKPLDFGPTEQAASGLAALTPRQREVLRELAGGLGNPAIAEKLGIEVSSVVNHLTAIYSALGVPENANPRVYSTLIFLGLLSNARVDA
jgi:DNA-binding NarL/FixJ family response regulator